MAEVNDAAFSRKPLFQSANYKLGRPTVRVAELTASDAPTADGFYNLGNAPEVSVALAKEYIEHIASYSGVKTVDAEILVSQELTGEMSFDEPVEKLAELFFGGEPAAFTNPTIAGRTEWELTADVKLGNSYPLLDSAGEFMVGIATEDLTVEKQGSPDTTLTLGTDYTVDEDEGTITFLTTSVVIVDGDAIDVTLAANAAAETTRKITALTREAVTVAMRIVVRNGRVNENDPPTEGGFLIWIPKAEIKPRGGFPLHTRTDFLTVPLSFKAIKKNSSTPFATIYPLPPGGAT